MSTTQLLSLCNRSICHQHRPFLSSRRYYSSNDPQRDLSASAKLFRDAANEEAEEAEQAARANRLNALQTKHEIWTGEESTQDAVLRMLVDKYKPLRSGPIRSADEKLKKAPPKVGDIDGTFMESSEDDNGGGVERVVVRSMWGASSRSVAAASLLPSVEGHQPWHTTFQVPSHAQSSIKYGHIPIASSSNGIPAPLDDKARRQAKEVKKRTEQAGRLRNAKESTLDYKIGRKDGNTTQTVVGRRVNPLGLKGWASLVEDRIEVRLGSSVFF